MHHGKGVKDAEKGLGGAQSFSAPRKSDRALELSENGDTPSHHPFLDGIVHFLPHPFGVRPCMETPNLE